MRGRNFGRRVKRQSHGQNAGNVFELRVAVARLRACHKDGASKTRPIGINTMGLNSHKNAQPWKGVLPEEQSVRAMDKNAGSVFEQRVALARVRASPRDGASKARPIRMDAGILCDRAEPPFTPHTLTATPHIFPDTKKAARRRLNSTPTGQVAIRFTGAFFCRSHITVSRRCSAIKANSKMPMAILVHQELSVPSKLIQV